MSTDDKRIREFAYQIWESEGRPEGQETRHWDMACRLAEAEALAPSKPAKATAGKARAKAKPAASAPAAPLGDKIVPEKKPRAPRKPLAS